MPNLMADFPYALESVNELPNRVRLPLFRHLQEDELPLYLFALPRRQDWWESIMGKPVEYIYFALTRRSILFLEDRKSGTEVHAFPIERLAYVEAGTVLLHSWLRVVPEPPAREFRVEYNSVFVYQMREAVRSIRALTLGLDPRTPHVRLHMLGEELLDRLPIKFNNVSREFWLQGEAALDVVLIPAIFVPYLRYFRRAHSFATELLLTNWQLGIIIEQGVEGAGKYGEAWFFCPLHRVRSLKIEMLEKPSGLGALHVTMSEGPAGTLTIPFPAAMELHLVQFMHRTLAEIERSKAPLDTPELVG